jgi:hypothetical protein
MRTIVSASVAGALMVMSWVGIGATGTHVSTTGQRPEPSAVVPRTTGQPPTSSCAVPQVVALRSTPTRRSNSVDGRALVRPAAQVTRNDRADVTFETRQTEDGAVAVVGKSGDLQITKTVHQDGNLVLDLTTDKDHVAITASGQGTTVTRGKTTIVLSRSGTSETKSESVRRLLADSKAVLQFRRVSAALIDTEDRSAPGLAMVVGDAVVGQLTGDVGAARRAAQHLAHKGADMARPASLRPECFQQMEMDMMYALNDYAACLGSVWGNIFWEDLCAWRWILEAESYWFQFVSCSGLGGLF